MTIDNLEVLAADLYKRAEEATPIVGDADRLDWMARKIDEVIEQKEPALNDLLQYETMDEVEAYMDKLYEHRTKEDVVEERALADSLEDREGIVTDRDDVVVDSDGRLVNRDDLVVDPVGDVLGMHSGADDEMDEIRNRKDTVKDYRDEVRDTKQVVKDHHDQVVDRDDVKTTCSGRVTDPADMMDEDKDRLEDVYVDERPQQPEYFSDDPNRFDPDLVIESETYMISDGVDERMRESIDNEDEHLTCKGQ